jgi:hypothetical protein
VVSDDGGWKGVRLKFILSMYDGVCMDC